jgi:hypothetical protein
VGAHGLLPPQHAGGTTCHGPGGSLHVAGEAPASGDTGTQLIRRWRCGYEKK